ncbi:hypothetical protein HDF18_16570 [Mucilaginibacter sp. X5P1]|uniref:hypothetical protein n=1 Tax=Mucilaginibacter sp. X5P1 TaxID=2723088 RepID=UPI0016217A4D|nr:hypothetical protein [Mucilaginibacter sp. X5P1]MBB6139245.1 hypothetical protein [Mucilaginibacter sp. X5P1]
MRLSLQLTLLLFSLFLILISCKKNDNVHSASPGVNVYISGTDNNDAVYWKNNTEVHLTNSNSNAYSSSIFVTPNNDVYVAGGQVTSGSSLAAYWKNGQVNYLTDSGAFVGLNYISVSGNDVYTAGLIEKMSNIRHAAYWKRCAIRLCKCQ